MCTSMLSICGVKLDKRNCKKCLLKVFCCCLNVSACIKSNAAELNTYVKCSRSLPQSGVMLVYQLVFLKAF